MDFDCGLLFQVRRQFKERGVWLRRDLPSQQREQLLVQGCRIATAMRKRCEVMSYTPEFHHSGNSAATNAKSISNLIKSAFASFVSKYQFLSQVS
jgi:hypothetical protein